MFQLNLPLPRSKTYGRGHNKERKEKIFKERKFLPCCFCDRLLQFYEATIEHIIPASKGGPSIMENLTISCRDCNSNRSSMSFNEWKKLRLHYYEFKSIVNQLRNLNKIQFRCIV